MRVVLRGLVGLPAVELELPVALPVELLESVGFLVAGVREEPRVAVAAPEGRAPGVQGLAGIRGRPGRKGRGRRAWAEEIHLDLRTARRRQTLSGLRAPLRGTPENKVKLTLQAEILLP